MLTPSPSGVIQREYGTSSTSAGSAMPASSSSSRTAVAPWSASSAEFTAPPGKTHAATAVRELEEEAGLALPADTELVPYSRWITPDGEGVSIRFDTWFYAARAPNGAVARPDGGECVDARWLTPAGALALHAKDELALVFPTIKHLERLSQTDSVDETLAAARGRKVEPVLPKLTLRDGVPQVLMPGDPGYNDA